MQFGMSYAQSKAITQLLTHFTKVPYAINELLYFEIKDKTSSIPIGAPFIISHKPFKRKSTDLFNTVNCLQIILPYCQKQSNINLQPIASFSTHMRPLLVPSLITSLTLLLKPKNREITSVPFHKPTEFLRTPMSLNDTMHL